MDQEGAASLITSAQHSLKASTDISHPPNIQPWVECRRQEYKHR